MPLKEAASLIWLAFEALRFRNAPLNCRREQLKSRQGIFADYLVLLLILAETDSASSKGTSTAFKGSRFGSASRYAGNPMHFARQSAGFSDRRRQSSNGIPGPRAL